jgi:hypothetical protein
LRFGWVFTQFFASLFLNKTKPRTRWVAQTILAGVLAAAFIGLSRDWLNLKLQIGGETALASLIGWIGVEAGFGWLGALFKQIFGAFIGAFIKIITNLGTVTNKPEGKDE